MFIACILLSVRGTAVQYAYQCIGKVSSSYKILNKSKFLKLIINVLCIVLLYSFSGKQIIIGCGLCT